MGKGIHVAGFVLAALVAYVAALPIVARLGVNNTQISQAYWPVVTLLQHSTLARQGFNAYAAVFRVDFDGEYFSVPLD